MRWPWILGWESDLDFPGFGGLPNHRRNEQFPTHLEFNFLLLEGWGVSGVDFEGLGHGAHRRHGDAFVLANS